MNVRECQKNDRRGKEIKLEQEKSNSEKVTVGKRVKEQECFNPCEAGGGGEYVAVKYHPLREPQKSIGVIGFILLYWEQIAFATQNLYREIATHTAAAAPCIPP